MISLQPVPLQISDYYILPLSLLPLPSFPVRTTHYLYVGKHKPKILTPATERSLFLINVPFDATTLRIRKIFTAQIGLPSGRIENIQFEGDRGKVQDSYKPQVKEAGIAKKGKKRKRHTGDGNLDEISGIRLPSTWNRELRAIGGTAVITLVDRASMEATIKAVQKTRTENKEVIWGEGVGVTQNSLGSSRMCCLSHGNFGKPSHKSNSNRVHKPPQASLS